MQHEPWVPDGFEEGIEGRKIAVVGYSHYGEGEDTSDATQVCLQNVIDEKWKIRFFSSIRNYFDFRNHKDFWSRVLFFNFAPRSIGGSNEKFAWIYGSEAEEANQRFSEILETYQPDIVFLFSSKIPSSVPVENKEPGFSREDRGRSVYYTNGGKKIKIVHLSHPQGASSKGMKTAIQDSLNQLKSSTT